MTHYIIYFNQEWVGDHSAEWFASRGPLARAAVAEMQAAGVLVFAGGVHEDVSAVPYIAPKDDKPVTSRVHLHEGYIGGFTIINVESQEEAIRWGETIAVACGWPQVVREVLL